MGEEVYLGVAERRGVIHIPWGGTHVFREHEHEPGTNLLVTLDTSIDGCAPVVKVDLPTLQQIKEMKDELASDWERLSNIFKQSSMERQVLMLRSLDINMRSWE